jgi:V/A-type H+-transporting ATPase subunit F
MGDYDSIYGFAALGLTIFPVDTDDTEAAAKTLRNLAENDFGVIYITEGLAAVLEKEMNRYEDRITPAIIQIPGVRGNTGAGVLRVKKSVEQAVGSDILFGNDE